MPQLISIHKNNNEKLWCYLLLFGPIDSISPWYIVLQSVVNEIYTQLYFIVTTLCSNVSTTKINHHRAPLTRNVCTKAPPTRVTTSGQRSRNQTYESQRSWRTGCTFLFIYCCVCTEVLYSDQNNDQATQYINQHSSAEVRFVPAKEPGTRAKSRKRYASASWAGWC